jgi:hypothetical protein
MASRYRLLLWPARQVVPALHNRRVEMDSIAHARPSTWCGFLRGGSEVDVNLSAETKMLIFELGVAIRQKLGRRYVRESDLSRSYSPEAHRCREQPLPNGNVMVYSLICHGTRSDEIGLTEEGWCVFEGLRAEYCNGCPEWFGDGMRREQKREALAI